jgi:hypothetical protein
MLLASCVPADTANGAAGKRPAPDEAQIPAAFWILL